MGLCSSSEADPKNKSYHLQTLDDHEGGINCAALSEDGSVMATGSEDHTARIWSTKTERCECIGILTGHGDYINAIAIEENFVITGSADKTVRKWDMGSCDCVHVFRGHNSLLNRLLCTGYFIFTSSYDRTARCWDFDSGECIRVFNGHKRGVYPLIFIPGEDDELTAESFDWDGNKDLLITGSADFTARSWSFETGKTLHVYKGHEGAVTCMATDPRGKTLFTGSTDNSIISWDILKGDSLKKFEGHTGSVICLTVIKKIMYSGSSDQTARAWVTEFGDCTRIYKGHKHSVSCIKYHDGLVITGCGDGITRCFDSKAGSLKRTLKIVTDQLPSPINSLQITGGKLFTGSHDGTLKVWDITGIRDDTSFNKDEDQKKPEQLQKNDLNGNQNLEKDNRIMIGDDDPESAMITGTDSSNNGYLRDNSQVY